MKTTHIENKGIVVKVTERYVVILSADGGFQNIPREKGVFPKIGDTFVSQRTSRWPFAGLRSGILVSALLIAILMFGMFSPVSPKAAYVLSVDINPSLEFYLDQQLQVVRIHAINEDGKKVAASLERPNGTIQEVMNETISEMVASGYLPPSERGLVTATVVSLMDDTKPIARTVKQVIGTSVTVAGARAKVNVFSAGRQLLEEAHDKNISVNRLRLYEKAQERGIELSLEHTRKASVKELAALADSNKRDMPSVSEQYKHKHGQSGIGTANKQEKGNGGESPSSSKNTGTGKSPQNNGHADQNKKNPHAKSDHKKTRNGHAEQRNDKDRDSKKDLPKKESHESDRHSGDEAEPENRIREGTDEKRDHGHSQYDKNMRAEEDGQDRYDRENPGQGRDDRE